jgi:hypothetical protein
MKMFDNPLIRYRLGTALIWLGVLTWAPFIMLRIAGESRRFLVPAVSPGRCHWRGAPACLSPRGDGYAASQNEPSAHGGSWIDLSGDSGVGALLLLEDVHKRADGSHGLPALSPRWGIRRCCCAGNQSPHRSKESGGQMTVQDAAILISASFNRSTSSSVL